MVLQAFAEAQKWVAEASTLTGNAAAWLPFAYQWGALCTFVLAFLYMRQVSAALVLVAGGFLERARLERGGSKEDSVLRYVYVAAAATPFLASAIAWHRHRAAVKREQTELFNMVRRAVREALEEHHRQQQGR